MDGRSILNVTTNVATIDNHQHRSQNHRIKDRFRKAEATPTNQPRSIKPKLIDRSFRQDTKMLLNRDRSSNTGIVFNFHSDSGLVKIG
jgi:RecA-family ATPase